MSDPKTPVLCPPDPLREFVAAVARRMGRTSTWRRSWRATWSARTWPVTIPTA